jgi:hypothetical protein
VFIVPESTLSYWFDVVGSIIVALYLIWSGVRTIYKQGKIQDLLEKYGGIRIPSIKRLNRDNGDKPDLIEPKVVSEVCAKILVNSDVDEVDMRYRIEWFKKLSDEGYYLSYDCDW